MSITVMFRNQGKVLSSDMGTLILLGPSTSNRSFHGCGGVKLLSDPLNEWFKFQWEYWGGNLVYSELSINSSSRF